MKEPVHQARWIALLTSTGIAVYLCWLMLKPFIGVLEWAIVLVIVFYPIHVRLAKKLKHRGLSALISCVTVVVIVVLPLTVLTIAMANELASLTPNLPSNLKQSLTEQSPVIGKASQWINDRFGVDTVRSQEFMITQIKHYGEILVGLSLNLMSNAVTGFVKVFFVIFTMYYLFRDGDKIVSGLTGWLPLSRKQSENIFLRTKEVVGASVYGVITIAMIQGFLGGLAFWALGVPSPVLWAVLMTFVCMVPVAGSFLVWLPASIYLMINGHWTKATLLIVWGILVISTIDNFLRPKLISDQTKLHELFIFFSVLGGISVFGLLGIVLGPVVLAVTLGLLKTLKQEDDERPAVADANSKENVVPGRRVQPDRPCPD